MRVMVYGECNARLHNSSLRAQAADKAGLVQPTGCTTRTHGCTAVVLRLLYCRCTTTVLRLYCHHGLAMYCTRQCSHASRHTHRHHIKLCHVCPHSRPSSRIRRQCFFCQFVPHSLSKVSGDYSISQETRVMTQPPPQGLKRASS
jgi:hypothetical protein